jgi:hypothetical protein
VSGFLDPQDTFDPSDDFMGTWTRWLIQADYSRATMSEAGREMNLI